MTETILINNDFLKADIEPNSIDLTITSPPYNVGINYNSHNDKINYKEYIDFMSEVLKKIYLLSKDDGRLCLNIPMTTQNIDDNKKDIGHKPLYVDIVNVSSSVGWKYNTTIIWDKISNDMKATQWGSWLSASAPYLSTTSETIIVLYKKSWKKSKKGQSDITKEEFMKYKDCRWNIQAERRLLHPAPFPFELPKRCIKLLSFVGDTILDPFLGSGTTLVASTMLNRNGVGVEIDAKYFEIAKNRILNNIGMLVETEIENINNNKDIKIKIYEKQKDNIVCE